MKLILTRHGETEENKQGILQGWLPGTLSKKGIVQVERLAQRFKDTKIDAMYTSDLDRARHTANAIHLFHPHIELRITSDLREKYLGDWTGKKKMDVQSESPPTNMESRQHLQDRVVKFLERVFHSSKQSTVMFVCHYGVIVALLSKFMSRPVENMRELEQGNTAVNIIEITEDRRHILHLTNCTAHL